MSSPVIEKIHNNNFIDEEEDERELGIPYQGEEIPERIYNGRPVLHTIMTHGYYELIGNVESLSCKYGRNCRGLKRKMQSSPMITDALPDAIDDFIDSLGIAGKISPCGLLALSTILVSVGAFSNPDPEEGFQEDNRSPEDKYPVSEE